MRVENCITIKRIVVIPDNEGKVANLRLYEIQRPAGISPRLALLGMKIGLVHVSKQKFIVKQTLAEWGEQSEEQVLVQNFLQAHTICAVVCSDPRMEKRFCFGGQDRQESFYILYSESLKKLKSAQKLSSILGKKSLCQQEPKKTDLLKSATDLLIRRGSLSELVIEHLEAF